MSVIPFSAGELANAAAVLSLGGHPADRKASHGYLAEALATISVANAAAYNRTYNERPTPADPEPYQPVAKETLLELLSGSLGFGIGVDPKRAMSTVSLLEYNTISNGGTEFADGLKTQKALTYVLGKALRAALAVARGESVAKL